MSFLKVVNEKNFIQSRLGIPYENLSESYLRNDVALATQQVISFNVQRNQVASPLATDRLLELNDEFVITQVRVALKQIASDTPTAAQQVDAIVQTYEDPTIFAGTNAGNVAAIYNGSLEFTINRKQFIPTYPVAAFRRVPDVQTNAYLITDGTTGSPAATFTGNSGVNGYSAYAYGFAPTEPVVISGRSTLDINVDLGTSVAFDDSSNTVYAVLELRGFLVVNAKS